MPNSDWLHSQRNFNVIVNTIDGDQVQILLILNGFLCKLCNDLRPKSSYFIYSGARMILVNHQLLNFRRKSATTLQ